MKYISTFYLVIMCSLTSAQDSVSRVWVADNGDGTYKNPIIHADYSDPDVVRVGEDFYLVSSSFNHVPGLPILHSKDLVNWKLIGHAIKRLMPDEHFTSVRHGGGIWAPSIRYHAGEFYIYYPDPDFGIYLVKAKNISGPWSEPILVESGKGLIDPCPLWDDDGRVYLVHAFAGSRAGIKSILVVKQLNSNGTATLSEGVMVYDGHLNDPTIEGPKMYMRNGYYYIFAPAGGVSTGWQLVLRSKNIYGPYERKVVMDQGETNINGPHQGAWVNTKTGEDWFIHFQDKDAYGRVVHLQPMKWVNNWPVIGADNNNDGKGEPVLNYRKPGTEKNTAKQTVADGDEFNSPKPGLQWQWQANPQNNWAFPTNTGKLRMYSVLQADSNTSIWDMPNILAQKLPAESFIAKIHLRFNPLHHHEKFGFIVFGAAYAYISIEKKTDGLTVDCRVNEKADQNGRETQLASYAVSGNEFFLEIKVEKGNVSSMGFADARQNYQRIPLSLIMKPGRWVGAKLGFFFSRENKTNDAGFVDIDWLRYDVITAK